MSENQAPERAENPQIPEETEMPETPQVPQPEMPPLDRQGRPYNGALFAACQNWARQEAAARQLYPDLDLAREGQNPLFMALLSGGADVLTAYEGANHRRLMDAAMARAAREGAGRAARLIAQRGLRPPENGAQADMHAGWQGLRAQDMSPGQIMELASKARRGVKTRLG